MKTRIDLVRTHAVFSQWLQNRTSPAWRFWSIQIFIFLIALFALALGGLSWFAFFFLGASWGPNAALAQMREIDPLINSLLTNLHPAAQLQLVYRLTQLLSIVKAALAVVGSLFALGGVLVMVLLYWRARLGETLGRSRQFCDEVGVHLENWEDARTAPTSSLPPPIIP